MESVWEQLLHLLFTSPTVLRSGDLDAVMTQVRQGIEAQLRNPLHAYHSRVRLRNYACYFFEPITLEELDKVDLEASCGHHNASFSNPSKFMLVLTGAARFATLLLLLPRYLATIPPAPGRGGRRDARSLTPLPFAFPDAPVVEDVEVDMVSPMTQIQITFPVGCSAPVVAQLCVPAVLETRLLQVAATAPGGDGSRRGHSKHHASRLTVVRAGEDTARFAAKKEFRLGFRV